MHSFFCFLRNRSGQDRRVGIVGRKVRLFVLDMWGERKCLRARDGAME